MYLSHYIACANNHHVLLLLAHLLHLLFLNPVMIHCVLQSFKNLFIDMTVDTYLPFCLYIC